MRTALVICLVLATHLDAESIARASSTSISTSTSPSVPFDVDEELAKIASSCFSNTNYEQLWGHLVRRLMARIFGGTLIQHSLATIGLAELRAALHFAPLRQWRPYNKTKPSEGELAGAPIIEAYYDMKEPRSSIRSLDSDYLFERHVTSAIAYLDERFPMIRAIYRRIFEEVRPTVLDRDAIDRMIDEFFAIYNRVHDAASKMQNRDECYDE